MHILATFIEDELIMIIKITVSSSIEKERNKMLSRIHVLLFDKNLVDVGKADVQFRG